MIKLEIVIENDGISAFQERTTGSHSSALGKSQPQRPPLVAFLRYEIASPIT